jgi:predicted dehydrogenase
MNGVYLLQRVIATALLMIIASVGVSAEPILPLKAGIVGLDAHARSWTRILNNPEAEGELADMIVVAGFPGGSPDIPQSMELLTKGLEPIRQSGVEIVDSIEALLPKVDVVLLLSIDGRPHLDEARAVFPSGKPAFIDKPAAGSLADAIELFQLAEKHNVACFSSSSLRFAPGTRAALNDDRIGPIRGCTAFSPAPIEPHHPDLFWYGIHGVETLYTLMGTGCRSVARVHTDGADVVVGTWADGRVGTFRGTREGPHTYGATVFGERGIAETGRFEGYEPLLVEMVKYFKQILAGDETVSPPVPHDTTLEILAFMEAADRSKRLGGAPVEIQPVLAEAKRKVRERSVEIED